MLDNSDKFEIKFKSCYYSDRLLNKVELLNKSAKNKVNIQEVKNAIYYAKYYHGDQKRESGEPYYSHPLEVAYMVIDYLFRTDIIVTSILHDTIEDTELTFEIIKSIFGEIVAGQVLDLTRAKEGGRKISSAEVVELLWHQKKYDVLLIKQFDRLHNIQTIAAKSPEKAKKIIEETISTFVVLAMYLETPELKQELVYNCLKAMDIKQDSPDDQDFSY
jgi:(p)ppGpp synthase/HD superfamily hydrolase